MACIPFFPLGSCSLERGVSGCDSLEVDGTDGFPMLGIERLDEYGVLHRSIVEKGVEKGGKLKLPA
jgi:hypothetical protein